MQKSKSDIHTFQLARSGLQLDDHLLRMCGLSQETLPQSGTQKLTNDEKSLLFRAIQENPRIKHSESLALVNYKVSRQTISRLFQSANHQIG